MITIFNRKEVCITHDMNRQAEVRYILQGAGIDYRIKTVNRKTQVSLFSMAGTRAYTGNLGGNQMMDYEYRIFVHKDDYEEAMHLIGKSC